MNLEPIKFRNRTPPRFTSMEEFLGFLSDNRFSPVIEFLSGEVNISIDQNSQDNSFITSAVHFPAASREAILASFQPLVVFYTWKPNGRTRESLSLVICIKYGILRESLQFLKNVFDPPEEHPPLYQQRMLQG